MNATQFHQLMVMLGIINFSLGAIALNLAIRNWMSKR